MEKVIFFENYNQSKCLCSGDRYFHFLDYAFACADFFMLVYVNYYGKGYSAIMKNFKKELEPFKVRSRTNPCWPGTPGTYSVNTTYKIVFYRTDEKAKVILKKVTSISDWKNPYYPQDLAFFKRNKCWFYSVAHENIAAIIRPTEKDLEFLEAHQLSCPMNTDPLSEYYRSFDEHIE